MGSYWSAPYFSKKVVQAEPAVKQETTEQKRVTAMETMVSSVVTSNADAFVKLSDKRPLSPICEVEEPKEDPLWKGVHREKLKLALQNIENWIPKPKAEPKEEPKAEPKEEPKAEPKEEPKAEPKEEPKAEPKEEPKEEPKAEPKEEPKAEPKAELKLDGEKTAHQEKTKLLLRDILNLKGKKTRLLVDNETLKTEVVMSSIEVTSNIAQLAVPSSLTESSESSSTELSVRIPEFYNNFNSASHAIKKFNKKHRKN